MADDPQREQLELLREIRDTLKAQRGMVDLALLLAARAAPL
jgi:hypothetical protein